MDATETTEAQFGFQPDAQTAPKEEDFGFVPDSAPGTSKSVNSSARLNAGPREEDFGFVAEDPEKAFGFVPAPPAQPIPPMEGSPQSLMAPDRPVPSEADLADHKITGEDVKKALFTGIPIPRLDANSGLGKMLTPPAWESNPKLAAMPAAAVNTATGLLSFLTSGAGIATAGVSSMAPAAAKAVAGLWSFYMAHEMPDKYADYGAAWDSMTPQQKDEALADMASNPLFALAAGLHAGKGVGKAAAPSIEQLNAADQASRAGQKPPAATPEQLAALAQWKGGNFVERGAKPLPTPGDRPVFQPEPQPTAPNETTPPTVTEPAPSNVEREINATSTTATTPATVPEEPQAPKPAETTGPVQAPTRNEPVVSETGTPDTAAGGGAVAEPRIPSYGEKYVTDHGPEKAQARVDYLDNRIQEELNQSPIDRGRIQNLIDEADNIRKAIAPKEPPPPAEAAKGEELTQGGPGAANPSQLRKARIMALDSAMREGEVSPEEKKARELYPEASDQEIQELVNDYQQAQASVKASNGAKPLTSAAGEVVGETPKPVEKFTTSIKNEQVDAERAERGLPPMVAPLKRSFGTVWDAAMREIDDDPQVQSNLIAELKDKPRALTDREDALLLQRRVDLKNEEAREHARGEAAKASGDDAGVVSAKLNSARIEDALSELDQVTKTGGTETARGLSARKMMAAEDYSLDSLMSKKRAANNFEPLTEAQAEQVRQQHADIEAKEKAYDDYMENQRQRLVQEEIDRQMKQGQAQAATQPTMDPRVISRARQIVNRWKVDRDAAETRLAEKLARTSVGVDPTILKEVAIIGRHMIGDAALTAAEWGAKMVERFGEKVRPYLEEGYKAANKLIDDSLKSEGADAPKVKRVMQKTDVNEKISDTAEKIEAKVKSDNRGEITPLVQKLARHFVEKGITERDALIDAVHDVLTRIDPDMTRRETMDAISGYGDFKQLTKDQISVQLRDLKGQMQQVGKLEDMASGIKPKPTGIERRTPTDTERRLIQQVNDMKRRNPNLRSTNPGAELKTALESRKTRLANQIKDLEHDIAQGSKTVREKGPQPTDADLEALKAKRDAVKAEHDRLFEPPKVTLTPEQIALKTMKTRLANRIDDLNARTAAGDFSSRPKRQVTLDPEAHRLKAAAADAKLAFDRGAARDRLNKRTTFEKVQDTFTKWRRGFLLSGPSTLLKLTSAAAERMAITPAEEGVGAVISKIIPRVAELAPREGGASIKAEAESITQAFTKGMSDAVQTIKTGHSELDSLYGKKDVMPRELIDFVGSIHGALKAPAKRAEFARSFQKRIEHAIANGADVHDPLVQTRIAMDAYKDANRSIFMQDNKVVTAYRAGLRILETPDKATGQIPPGRKALATALKVALPIVKVPTNIVAETLQYATGSVTGSTRLAFAMRRGIENLHPDQADLIMRELKKGSLGAAFLVAGYLAPQMFGGYYQPGEKRDKGDVKYGGVKLGRVQIPSILVHNPLLETLQIGATVRRVADSKFRKKDTEPKGFAEGVKAATVGTAEEIPFVREMLGLADLREPGKHLNVQAGDLVRNVAVPQAAQQSARYFDKDAEGETIKRKPTNFWQSVEMGVPGLRKDVPEVKKR